MTALTRHLDQRWYPGHEDHWDIKAFAELVKRQIGAQAHVLDFGAGRGNPHFALRGRVRRIDGVDVDEAVFRNPSLDGAALLTPPDYRIPHPDQTFDAVVALNVVEHLPDPVQSFREIRRVLKPGGIFVFQTPNRRHYVSLAARLTPHWFHEWFKLRAFRGVEKQDVFPTLYRSNTPGAIRAAAAAAGLEVRAITLTEGRPEYLRGAAPLYVIGWAWERAVNTLPFLASFRVLLTATLARP